MGLHSCHAPRRIIKRPFEADPTLAEITQSVFFGKHSIVAAVENSILLKNRFEHHCSKFAKLPSIRSLSLAKQRFDSTQKPIRRLCLYLVPFLLTVIELSREKKNDENGQRASAFLAYCSEEILVQIGMIADAGDEGGQLCRALIGHSTHFATARQSHASEAAECNDMVLLLDHDVSTQGQLVSLARKVGSL